MCGIIGYTGINEASGKITEGLSVLEYRGYDSVGICRAGENGTEIIKTRGRVSALKEKLKTAAPNFSTCAIGHTRWATHGSPSDINAHPHNVGNTFLVHNGIIENYGELKAELMRQGVSFKSDTDTEVGCAVIDSCFNRCADSFEAIKCATAKLRGSYAFAIMRSGETGTLYAVRQGSPLIIAKGEDGYYLASDLTALLPFTKTYYPLKEGEIVRLTRDTAMIYGKGEPEWKTTQMSFEAAKKGGYEHFMLKEMYEQPECIKKCLSPRITHGLPDFSPDGLDKEFFEGIRAIHIVACGSAMHAGLVASAVIEGLAKIPCKAYIASEYRYSPPLSAKGTLVIVVSQSGETADSLACLRYAKSVGLKTLGIVNAVETTIAREADYRAYTYAGPEIAVATTKGYTTQASLMYLFAVALALNKGEIDENRAKSLTECLLFEAPRVAKACLDRAEELKNIAKAIYKRDDIFYIGRGLDYALSQEAALKLKEISYIHCEAYAAGELKHGTISLIEEGTPVIAISTESRLFDKLDSNIKEVKSRGAFTVLICTEGAGGADLVFELPRGKDEAMLFGALMAVQMIAYEVAVLRGCDVDKPRNLAKSVTVE